MLQLAAMVRFVIGILALLLLYLLGTYKRAIQCKEEWERLQPSQTYTWNGREETWDPTQKTTRTEWMALTYVSATTTLSAELTSGSS